VSSKVPSPPLLTHRRGTTLVLTLNRPHSLNAVSLPLYRLLTEAVAGTAEDTELRTIVLTGAGRAFCVGADLKAHGEAEPTADDRRRYVLAAQEANRSLQEAPLPVVAAVNGHAVGAGLELALSADFIVVAREAKLRLPEVALGTLFGGGVSYTLPARVGAARARELLLLAPFVSGEEAAEMGLADVAVPSNQVTERALRLAGELEAMAPLSLHRARTLLREAPGRGRAATLEAEAESLLACMETEDWREGVEAFREKRKPRFRGG